MKKEKNLSAEQLPDNIVPANTNLRQRAESSSSRKPAVRTKQPGRDPHTMNLQGTLSQIQIELTKGANADQQNLIHEFEILRNELELQQEELRQAIAKAESVATLYDFAPAGYFTLDPEGTICELNLNGAALLGLERTELVTRNFKQFVDTDTQSAFRSFLQKAFETKSKQTCDLTLTNREKPFILVHLEGIVINDEKKCHVVAIDLTGRDKAEEILKNNYALLRIAGETAKFGGWSIDVPENKITWSEEVAAIHETPPGYSPEMNDGINFYAPEWRDKITGAINNCAEKGISFNEEMEIITAKENRIWIRVIGEAIRDQNGKIVKILGSFQNISARKKSELALNQSSEKFQTLLELAPDAFFQGDSKGNFITVNDKAIELTGFSRAALISMNMRDLFPADVLNNVPLRYDLLKKGDTIIIEREIKRKSGERIQVEMNSKAMPDGTYQCFMRDITERKQTQKVLQESEARHRLLADNANDVIWTMNLDGRFTYVSPSVEKLRGYTVAEVMQQSLEEVLTPESAALAQKELINSFESLEEGRPLPESRFEFEQPCKDGSTVWTEATTSGIFDPEGKFIGILGVTRDITERKLTEELLKVREERFRQLIKNSFDIIVLLDANGIQQFVSDSCEKILGYRPEELINIPVIEQMVHPEDQERLIAAFKNAMNLGHGGVQYRHRHKNGTWVYLEAFGTNQIDNPHINAFVLNVRDITERKNAEAALHESEEKHRILLDESSDPIFTFYPDGQYRYVNRAFADGVGKKQEEIIGKKIWDVFSKDEADKRFAAVKWVFENGEAKVIEVRVPRPDGDHWYLTTVKPILDELGKVITVICISKEITERKNAEEALKKSEASLHELNATKDKFFSIIAHDLKNPFHSIMGFSNILVSQIQENDYNGIEKYANIIQNSSVRALDLLLNLLEWARLQTGRMEFAPESFEIVDLITETTKLLNDYAQQKSITIYKDIPTNATIVADKAMIGAVLRNLISNAIKFTRPDANGAIVVSVEQKQDEMMVTVSDNGVGIKKEAIGKLFRIDENQSTMGTQNEKGTGLGLILCKEFVEKHGGKIWVESETNGHPGGRGSKFYFTIPKILICQRQMAV